MMKYIPHLLHCIQNIQLSYIFPCNASYALRHSVNIFLAVLLRHFQAAITLTAICNICLQLFILSGKQYGLDRGGK